MVVVMMMGKRASFMAVMMVVVVGVVVGGARAGVVDPVRGVGVELNADGETLLPGADGDLEAGARLPSEVQARSPRQLGRRPPLTREAMQQMKRDQAIEEAAEERIPVTFANMHDKVAELFWVSDTDGSETQVGTLAPQGRTGIQTYVGHIFLAKEQGTGRELASFVVTAPTELIITAVDHCFAAHGGGCRRQDLEDTAKIARERKASDRRREGLNKRQPSMVPTFTPLGFERRDIPPTTYKWLKEFYDNNQQNARHEHWDRGATYVNHWESDIKLVPFAEGLKPRLFDELRETMEGWSNTELEPTACYGIRTYGNGSILNNHVDRLQTHAISAILNVHQDVEEDWPLHIVGHDGVTHKVTMDAGQMILYESAKCIHGRPEPLNGTVFANMFLHYKPKHDWEFDFV